MRLLPILLLLGCVSENTLIPNEERSKPSYLAEEEPLDVLVILDTSCSMFSDMPIIEYGLIRTAEDLSRLDFNWRLAVTTSSKSVNAWYEVTRSEDPGWEMSEAVHTVKSLGREEESGFDAANARQNQKRFFRDKAQRLLIFVSDEDDQSRISTETFLANQPEDVIIGSVIGLPVPSTAHDNAEYAYCADVGNEYLSVSDAVVDICEKKPWSIIKQLLE